jgi:hypothetical protein
VLDEVEGVEVRRGQQERVKRVTELHIEAVKDGKTFMSIAPTNRENRDLNAAIHERRVQEGLVSKYERQIEVYQSLGWELAERQQIKNLKPGMIIEETTGEHKGRAWEVKKVSDDGEKAWAFDKTGLLQYTAHKGNADKWAACEKAVLIVSPGDAMVTHAGMNMGKRKTGKVKKYKGHEYDEVKMHQVPNGFKFTLERFGLDGSLIATDGTKITTKNLALAYSMTSHKSQSGTRDRGVVSSDEHSIRVADRPLAYVSGTRFREKLTVIAPDKHALAGIQARTADRNSASDLLDNQINPNPVRRNMVQETIDRIRREAYQAKKKISNKLEQSYSTGHKMGVSI